MNNQQAVWQDKVKGAGRRQLLQGGGIVYSECNGKQLVGFTRNVTVSVGFF